MVDFNLLYAMQEIRLASVETGHGSYNGKQLAHVQV